MSVLVFAAQVFVVWWAIVWVAHRGQGVNTFRLTCRQIRACATWPVRAARARAARREQDVYRAWAAQLAWWGHERGRHPFASVEWETANDMITYLESVRPATPRSYP